MSLLLLFPTSANTRAYSRSSVSSLPTDTARLLVGYTDSEANTVETVANTTDVSVTTNVGPYMVHQFAKHNASAQQINVTWTGKVGRPASAATVHLQIYDFNTSAWEDLATNTTVAANTSFTMTGTQSASVANYYNASGFAYIRVYQ